MQELSFSKIQNKLIVEEKFSVIHAALMTANILNYYDESVKNAVMDWSEGKDISSFVVGEYSVDDILEEVGCTVFQALCILQLLKVNPDSFADAVLVLEKDSIR